MGDGIIEISNAGYDYHGRGTKTIAGVSFTITCGEFVLIAGKSGSGKTTVAKCINGLIPYFHEGILTGDVFIHDRNTKDMALHEIGGYIGSVFQDPRSQFFTTNTTDEVAFGCQNMGLPKEEIFSRVKNAFLHLDIETLANRSIFKISNGEKQKIAIASCFAMNPDIYLFDEPSANLDITSTLQLAQIMKKLKEDGKTIIVVEHRLYYLKDLIDRVIFMENGKIANSWTRDDITGGFDSGDMSKVGLREFNLNKVHCRTPATIRTDKTDFSVKGLTFAYKKDYPMSTTEILRNINFTAGGGEIIGIVGRNGTGKTTLSKLCCGLLKEKMGAITLNGEILSYKKRLGKIYMVMQDSDYQLFSDSVITELTLGFSDKIKNKNHCEEVLDSLGLLQLKDYHPAALSRGQKQRLTIAAAVMSDAKVIFLDEPTSGLDGEAMKQVSDVISSLAEKGCIIFVVTHDYEFLLESATRILHLSGGTITDDFPLCNQTEEKLTDILFGAEEVVFND
jgi:energy-coupling factor transport system ATP-binding protein